MKASFARRLAGDLVVLVLVLAPILAPWILRGLPGVFAYLAADSFIYLAIAERSLGAPFPIMDGTHPTNGFHPLWQAFLGAVFPFSSPSPDAKLHLIFGASLFFAAAGLVLVARVVTRVTGNFALALLAVVPGWYALLVSPVHPHFGSSWSYVNGMESPLSLLAFGLFLQTASSRPLRVRHLSMTRVIFLAATVTLMLFARLDDGAILLAMGAYLAVELGGAREWSKLGVVLGLPAASIAGYLAWNFWTCGMALPVSAMAKSVPALLQNLAEVVGVVLPARLVLHPGDAVWSEVSWRALQLAVPAALAALTLLASARGDRGRHSALMSVLATYILIRFLHSLASASLSTQGHWYFAVSITSFNVLVSYHVARILRRMRIARHVTPASSQAPALPHTRAAFLVIAFVLVGLGALGMVQLATASGIPVRKLLVSTAGCLLLLVSGAALAWRTWRGSVPCYLSRVATTAVLLFCAMRAAAFTDLKMRPGYNAHYLQLFQDRVLLAAELHHLAPGAGLVELDDGIFAFSLPRATLSGLGFAMDREAFQARQAGELLALAHRRGATVLASLNYFRAAPGESSATLRERLARLDALSRQDLAAFDFEVILADERTGATFIRFTPARK